MPKIILKVRIALWLALAIAAGWFVYLKIVPSGKISYLIEAGRPNFFISKLSPAERVETAEGRAVIKGDPAYFYLRAPREFNRVKLTFKYKIFGELPVVEAGLLLDKKSWQVDLRPLRNKTIDQLALVWDVARDNGVMLLQRQKKYGSVEEFLSNLPERGQIAAYNYDLSGDFHLPDYEKQNKENVISRGLRGRYQFYTYVKGETLDDSFSFTDLNKSLEADPIELAVWRGGQAIHSQRLDDLTNNEKGAAEPRGEINLKLFDLPEGLYKVVLNAGDDIVTEKIVSRQSKLSFVNKIWLADRGGSVNLWSEASNITVQTINPAKLQTVRIGGRQIKIAETYRQYSVGPADNSRLIELEKDDLLLSGNGLFSFAPDSLLDLAVKKVDADLDINRAGINYVLANYDLPGENFSLSADQTGWRTGQAEFNLGGAYSEQSGIFGAKKYVFLISLPGLKAEEPSGRRLELKEIKAEFTGVSLRQKLFKFISGL